MTKLISWIKDNWKDPVWSGVFSAIILLVLGNVGLLFLSLFKRIPFQDLYLKVIDYLINEEFKINLLVITIVIFGLLVLLIPMMYLKIISFQLKRIKFPSTLRKGKLELKTFISSEWTLNFENTATNNRGQEILTINEGNKYSVNGNLEFILTDIIFDESKNQITWTKIRYSRSKKHSTETLRVESNDLIIGQDDLGYSLRYTRIPTNNKNEQATRESKHNDAELILKRIIQNNHKQEFERLLHNIANRNSVKVNPSIEYFSKLGIIQFDGATGQDPYYILTQTGEQVRRLFIVEYL